MEATEHCEACEYAGLGSYCDKSCCCCEHCDCPKDETIDREVNPNEESK